MIFKRSWSSKSNHWVHNSINNYWRKTIDRIALIEMNEWMNTSSDRVSSLKNSVQICLIQNDLIMYIERVKNSRRKTERTIVDWWQLLHMKMSRLLDIFLIKKAKSFESKSCHIKQIHFAMTETKSNVVHLFCISLFD